jgi:tRNA dimethylallyltransferase
MNQTVITDPILVLVGPTAIGKTALSLEIAKRYGCEIVSMDSMQVYRYMDIGTAKATNEEMRTCAHYLIDIRNPDEQYDAASFCNDALAAIRTIHAKNKIPLITGGTGLYLKALVNGLLEPPEINPTVRSLHKDRLKKEGREPLHAELLQIDSASGKRIHQNDTQRLLRALEIYYSTGKTWSTLLEQQKTAVSMGTKFTHILQVGLQCERDTLFKRINMRSENMMQDGLVKETIGLRDMGYAPTLSSMQSIGYRHANKLIDQEWTPEQTLEELARDTRRYAKRQLTWFGAQSSIHWFHVGSHEPLFGLIDKSLNT